MSGKPSLPPPIDDAVFGRLTWCDSSILSGEFEYAPGLRVRIELGADFEKIAVAEMLSFAQAAVERLRHNERQIRVRTAEELQTRRRDTKVKLSDLDVANVLRIDRLQVLNKGEGVGLLTIYWHDTKLFSGRWVVTRVGPSGKFIRVEVAGAPSE
jgi:hypothetical protein